MDHTVYNTVFGRFLGSHIEIPLDILKNLFDGFLGRLFVDAGEHPARGDEVAGVDFDVRGLPADLLHPGLVNQDLGQGPGKPFAGGAAGKRMALPHAKILIHQPWVQQVGGQATDIEIHARDLIATRRALAGIYEETTKKPIDQILKDIERDFYMTSQEAKDYGIIDTVIEDRRSLAPPA